MGTRYVNTSSKTEERRLKVIFEYIVENKLNHDSLILEIVEKRCKLSTTIREYLIMRDFLGKRILIDASK